MFAQEGKVNKFYTSVKKAAKQNVEPIEAEAIKFMGYCKKFQYGRTDRNRNDRLVIIKNKTHFNIEHWLVSAGDRIINGYYLIPISNQKHKKQDDTALSERVDYIVDNRPTALTDDYKYWEESADNIYTNLGINKKYECPRLIEKNQKEEFKINFLNSYIATTALNNADKTILTGYLRFTQTPTIETLKTWQLIKSIYNNWERVIDSIMNTIENEYKLKWKN
jgi:hypothetical protein